MKQAGSVWIQKDQGIADEPTWFTRVNLGFRDLCKIPATFSIMFLEFSQIKAMNLSQTYL